MNTEKQKVEVILKKAYADMADLLERGIKVLPAAAQPCWDVVRSCCSGEAPVPLGMYEIYLAASREYKNTSIGADNVFSSVIDVLGVRCGSAEWYRVMAYHYIRRAEALEAGGGSVASE